MMQLLETSSYWLDGFYVYFHSLIAWYVRLDTIVWSFCHPRMKNICGWSRSFRSVKMHYLGVPFSTFKLNFNLCSKDNHPYTDKEYMDFREGRSLKWLVPLGPPKSHEWMVSWISIKSHLNCRPIHLPKKNGVLKPSWNMRSMPC